MAAVPALSNNISVTKVVLTGRDISAGPNNASNFVYVKFNIGWDNSWRTSSAPNNWDAAWVFVKYKVGSGDWQHATLSTNSADDVAATGSTITPSTDGKGVYIYRSSDGTGNVDFTGTQLRWNYGQDGVADTAGVIVRVFAIEMVYVPTGSFYLGSGGWADSAVSAFYRYTSDGYARTPFLVSSENALSIIASPDSLWYAYNGGNSGDDGIVNATVPATFPKGYAAFYCMKYDITQEQYVDFLNALTYTQQVSRTAVAPSSSSGTAALTPH